MTAFLTIDLGNSRCKLRLWGGGPGPDREPTLRAGVDLDTAPGVGRAANTWLGELAGRGERAQHAGLSSVAQRTIEEELAAAVAPHVGGLQRVLVPGLAVDCREPEKVGPDRLWAARGALALVGGSAIVVDAGTALTVDALRAESGTQPVFLGGAIAPGPALLADALARRTARLPRIVPLARAPALGRDTEGALQAGVVVGFRGAARELVERVGLEAGLADACAVITGGARGFLLEPGLLFGARRIHVEPELVGRGLLAALLELDRARHETRA